MRDLAIVFILPPRVHLLDITGPAHIFYEAADYGAPVTLSYCTMFTDKTESVSSGELYFHQLKPYNELSLEPGDVVFIPGLEKELLLDDDFIATCYGFLNWLKQQQRNGVLISSVCTGAFLLAAAGMLDGLSCTTHWKYADRFQLKYPKVRLQSNRLFVQEGNIFTSAGVASGIDLALYLVQQLWGAHFAAQIAKEAVIYFRRGPDDAQLSIFTQYRNHLDQRIHNIQDQLVQALDQKINLGDLADKVSMSPRNMTRLFKATTGITIGAYLEQLRIERATQLLGEGHTMQAVAASCGLKSTNQLRRLLHGKQA